MCTNLSDDNPKCCEGLVCMPAHSNGHCVVPGESSINLSFYFPGLSANLDISRHMALSCSLVPWNLTSHSPVNLAETLHWQSTLSVSFQLGSVLYSGNYMNGHFFSKYPSNPSCKWESFQSVSSGRDHENMYLNMYLYLGNAIMMLMLMSSYCCWALVICRREPSHIKRGIVLKLAWLSGADI